jgi:ParB family chromosome partitioning protein
MMIRREVRAIPLRNLEISASQVRRRDLDKDLDELVQNIRTHGQLAPIVVARIPHSDQFEVIAGQRRVLAHQKLGIETIEATILPESVDEATARVLSISENVARVDLNPKDLIDACTALYKKYGTVEAIAQELGLPTQKVRAYVKYDRLQPALRASVDSGEAEIGLAIKIEDALSEIKDADLDVTALASALGKLSRAQQNRVLKGAQVEDLRALSLDGAPLPQFRVAQIIVTLSAEVHRQLKVWAADQAITQDEAAVRIISDFLAQTDLLAASGVPDREASPADGL